MNATEPVTTHRAASRPSRTAEQADTIRQLRRDLLAAEYREAVLKRRISYANDHLFPLGVRVSSDPFSRLAVVFLDGLPVAPGV